jgi:hypothetical protein
MFAYCQNNPVMFSDPTGTIVISITTLILIGSIGLGVAAGGYTAYKEYQAGFNTWQIVGDSLCAGFAAFSIAYTGGMSLYQCYQNYCYLNAIAPVTHIGSAPSPATQLQSCADAANSEVAGNGPVAGTKKHGVFAQNVNDLGRSDLSTEVSYKNGAIVPYGTKGSVRFDVVQYSKSGTPIAAWDFKTGAAKLTGTRILEMHQKSGLSIPIFYVR